MAELGGRSGGGLTGGAGVEGRAVLCIWLTPAFRDFTATGMVADGYPTRWRLPDGVRHMQSMRGELGLPG